MGEGRVQEVMELFLSVVLGVSVIFNVAFVYGLARLSKRLLQFDELFELLQHDVKTNTEYFNKLLQTPLFNNSPEVISMTNNVKIISQRLEEYSLRMFEATNKDVPPSV